jgi:hypothetical protein
LTPDSEGLRQYRGPLILEVRKMRTTFTTVKNSLGQSFKEWRGDFMPTGSVSEFDRWLDTARNAEWIYAGGVWQPVGGDLVFVEDFLAPAGTTPPKPWGTQDTSTSGSPTLDYVNDAAGGHYVLKLATTNEVEAITLYFADQLVIDAAKKPILGMRVKFEPDVTGAGGAMAAGDITVMGLASDRNATFDSVAGNAWFRLEGANKNILCETDDGTIDTDDKDTGQDWTANTWMWLMVDLTLLSSVKFWVNGIDRTPQTMKASALTGNLQPFIEVTKAAATNKDHRLTIDKIFVVSAR